MQRYPEPYTLDSDQKPSLSSEGAGITFVVFALVILALCVGAILSQSPWVLLATILTSAFCGLMMGISVLVGSMGNEGLVVDRVKAPKPYWRVGRRSRGTVGAIEWMK